MPSVKARICIAENGSISGHTLGHVTAGEYETVIPLPSFSGRPSRDVRLARMLAIADHCAALPVLDSRSPEEILGYDDNGLPH